MKKTLLLASFVLLGRPVGGAPEEDAVLFRGVRLFDGRRVVRGVDVLVRHGRIARCGKHLRISGAGQVVEGRGRTLLPGLIDSHVHVRSREQLRQALVFGVTTALDLGTRPEVAAALREEQRRGAAGDRADLFSAGTQVTGPGGHPVSQQIPRIEGPAAAQAFVDDRLAEGSDYIKVVYDDGKTWGVPFRAISAATLGAVVHAAHVRKRLAIVHAGSLREAREALEAGADGLAHMVPDAAPDRGFVDLIRRRRAFFISTLVPWANIARASGGTAVSDDARLARYLSADALGELGRYYTAGFGSGLDYRSVRESVRRLAAAGVPILAGTDVPGSGRAYGASLHHELELLVGAGLTPLQALRAATSVPADAFGLRDRGRVAQGRRADLVLVEGDPASNVADTRNIVGVWKAGRAVDREAKLRADLEPLTVRTE